jgi:hypothetical protein
VHEEVNVDSSAFITDESDVPINTITDMTVASVHLPQSFKTALDDDVSAMCNRLGPVQPHVRPWMQLLAP